MSTKPDVAGGTGAATPAPKKPVAKSSVKAKLSLNAKEELGMKRWLRVTARKALSSPKSLGQSGNAAADAAAEAIAKMMKEEKKLA